MAYRFQLILLSVFPNTIQFSEPSQCYFGQLISSYLGVPDKSLLVPSAKYERLFPELPMTSRNMGPCICGIEKILYLPGTGRCRAGDGSLAWDPLMLHCSNSRPPLLMEDLLIFLGFTDDTTIGGKGPTTMAGYRWWDKAVPMSLSTYSGFPFPRPMARKRRLSHLFACLFVYFFLKK